MGNESFRGRAIKLLSAMHHWTWMPLLIDNKFFFVRKEAAVISEVRDCNLPKESGRCWKKDVRSTEAKKRSKKVKKKSQIKPMRCASSSVWCWGWLDARTPPRNKLWQKENEWRGFELPYRCDNRVLRASWNLLEKINKFINYMS